MWVHRAGPPAGLDSLDAEEAAEMFIQVIQGKVADPAALRAAVDRWGQDPQSGAEGRLGTTAGSWRPCVSTLTTTPSAATRGNAPTTTRRRRKDPPRREGSREAPGPGV